MPQKVPFNSVIFQASLEGKGQLNWALSQLTLRANQLGKNPISLTFQS